MSSLMLIKCQGTCRNCSQWQSKHCDRQEEKKYIKKAWWLYLSCLNQNQIKSWGMDDTSIHTAPYIPILPQITLYWPILPHGTPYCPILPYVTPYCSIILYITPHYPKLPYITPHCPKSPCYPIPPHIILCYPISPYTALYYPILPCISPYSPYCPHHHLLLQCTEE